MVGWGIGPIFPSTFRNVFIFLTIVGQGQSLMLHGVHLINCVILSLLKMCIPCIEVIFTSTSTTSTGSRHLKQPCRKLHSDCRMHAILKDIKNPFLIYTISGNSVSKVNHFIPCLIIM